MELFDLHCDTAHRMHREKQPLKSNGLQIALDKLTGFSRYMQVAAIWSDERLSDEEAYTDFWRILGNFKKEIDANRQRAALCCTYEEAAALPDGTSAFFLAVEDARLLSGNIERIYDIYDAGVRILSLNWKGENALGGGYDTNAPLTDLGEKLARRAFDLGMVVDVSHSSAKVIDELADIAAETNSPIIATHSDADSVAVHPRNLTDAQFIKIRKSGGICGICLYPDHLCGLNTEADIPSIIRHIEYFLGLDGQNNVCLGCDFDGIEKTPAGIENIADLYKLADALAARNFSDELIDAIFYRNAQNFFKKAL